MTAVRRWSTTIPDRPACTFVDHSRSPVGEPTTLTYAELDVRARAVAVAVAEAGGLEAPVAILCPSGLDYVVAFLACLYAGAVAVPLFEPDPARSMRRITVVLADAGPAVLLTTSAVAPEVARMLKAEPGAAGRTVIAVDEVPASRAGAWRPPARPEPDQVAYLQYTSGSTRNPAGVMVGLGHLAACCAQLRPQVGLDTNSPGVVGGWLPLYHDMGLVYTVALPLSAGAHTVLMSPAAFVKQPRAWLGVLSDWRVNITSVAPFALDLILRRVQGEDQLRGVDLSSLDVLMIGAEPVKARSLTRFVEVFAARGLRPEACCPAYGLAEATLVATHESRWERPLTRIFDRAELWAGKAVELPAESADGGELVACGVPIEQEVAIVDPASALELPEGRAGEVWVRGPNVAGGYWRQPERTGEIFDGRLRSAGRGADAGWLRTGDRGFQHEGRLFLCGRLKEMIIIDGRNHFPVDIELTVEQAAPDLRVGHTVAFGVPDPADGAERVVVVAETERPDGLGREGGAAVRGAVHHDHGIGLADLVVVPRGTLPKTSSGKIRRLECRADYLNGSLPSLSC